MIIDIRKENVEEIEGIQFDYSGEYIAVEHDNDVVSLLCPDGSLKAALVRIEEIDNLIKALQKAKEIWG